MAVSPKLPVLLAVVGRPERVAGVLDEPQAVLLAERLHGVEVERVAQGVGHHDRSRPRADGLAQGGRDGVVGAQLDIDQDRLEAVLDDRVDRGREAHRDGEDLVALHEARLPSFGLVSALSATRLALEPLLTNTAPRTPTYRARARSNFSVNRPAVSQPSREASTRWTRSAALSTLPETGTGVSPGRTRLAGTWPRRSSQLGRESRGAPCPLSRLPPSGCSRTRWWIGTNPTRGEVGRAPPPRGPSKGLRIAIALDGR